MYLQPCLSLADFDSTNRKQTRKRILHRIYLYKYIHIYILYIKADVDKQTIENIIMAV